MPIISFLKENIIIFVNWLSEARSMFSLHLLRHASFQEEQLGAHWSVMSPSQAVEACRAGRGGGEESEGQDPAPILLSVYFTEERPRAD